LQRTRIGLFINTVRKANAETHVQVSTQCRQIVRVWSSLHAGPRALNAATYGSGNVSSPLQRASECTHGHLRLCAGLLHTSSTTPNLAAAPLLKPVTPVDRFRAVHSLTPSPQQRHALPHTSTATVPAARSPSPAESGQLKSAPNGSSRQSTLSPATSQSTSPQQPIVQQLKLKIVRSQSGWQTGGRGVD
jgi:hypothetical protein